LGELTSVFPHITREKEAKLYLIELRNENNKLVKRFKPFKEVTLNTGEYWHAPTKKWNPCLELSEDIVSRLNMGVNYRVTIALITYDRKPFLPLEIKCVGYDSERIFEYLSKIETNLLSLIFEHGELNEAVSYLWDAYFRLEENDIEGARTSIRKALDEVIRKELIPKIKVIDEVEDFPKRLENLVKGLIELVQYGGPHRGPAPKTTTEMIIAISIKLIEYLARAFETKVISLKEGD